MANWPDVLSRLIDGDDLTAAETRWALAEVMEERATPAQLAGFLVGLRAKGESAEEVAGLVQAMLEHAAPIEIAGPVVDVVGTGGDGSDSVNLSTMAALVVAAAGHRVVKHGNRAASSRTGSADLLEALGVRLDLDPQQVAHVAETAGITFCFAPVFHPAMRHAGPTRRELGVPTVFNILGPLANPSRPQAMAVGCADVRLAPVMAEVLGSRGVTAVVVRGDDGMDELSTVATSTVWRWIDGRVISEQIDAASLGLPRSVAGDLAGGDPAHNATIARAVLGGEPGPVADAVALNAAAAIAAAVAEGSGGWGDRSFADWLAEALPVAQAALAAGEGAAVLERWVAATMQAATA